MEISSDQQNSQPTIDDIKSCLQRQLDEYEMLSSIFCNPGEFHVDDHSILADIDQYINGKSGELHRKLDYVITLNILQNDKLRIHFELPHSYPLYERATILAARCTSATVSKQTQQFVQQKLRANIKCADRTDVYVYQVMVWLQENIDQLLHEKTLKTSNDANELNFADGLEDMERLWIYSHHIKSKKKRQDIVKLTKDLHLSGFCRPGKPGIICVEGLQMNTTEFWKIVRVWSWHRICIRADEQGSRPTERQDEFRRFNGFQELIYTEVDDDVVPMDMAMFIKFLDDHQSKYVSKDLFGFE